MTQKITINLDEYVALKDSNVQLKREKVDLTEVLEDAVDRANRYEDKAARWEQSDEALEAAWHVVFALEAALGLEKSEETLGVFVLRRTVEAFRDLAKSTHPTTKRSDLVCCLELTIK